MAKAKAEDKALVVADTQDYSVIVDGGDFKQLMDVNLGGETIDASMLDRVTFPSGKSTSFIIPNEDGENDDVKAFEGIIVFTRNHRAMFGSDEITGDPPVCSSEDMINGRGKPGGACIPCPNNQFGTATKGAGKACKEKREVHIVVKGNDLPIILDVPSASLVSIKKYLLALSTKKKVPQYGIITKFSLASKKGSSGTDFAQLVVTPGEKLSPEDTMAMEKYSKGYSNMIKGIIEKPESENPDPNATTDQF